jgi:hypothetical protein
VVAAALEDGPWGTMFGWLVKFQEGGPRALRARPVPGKPPKLNGAQVRRRGLSPQRPLWQAWKAHPAPVARWLAEALPAIRAYLCPRLVRSFFRRNRQPR